MQAKSLTELRTIALSLGIKFSFADDKVSLTQKIEQKQIDLPQPRTPLPPRPAYDSRLMSKPPAKICTQSTILEYLKDHISQGLHVSFPTEETWEMRCGKKTDSGTMRMPPKVLIGCAERVMA